MTSLTHTLSQSRRYALIFFLSGLLAIWLFGSQTDEMFRILCLSYAVTSLAATGVMLRIALAISRSRRTPAMVTRPLETQDDLPPHPSRHLVGTSLVAILEATARFENQMPGKCPKPRNLN